METEILLFQVDDQLFGVTTSNVREVLRAAKLAALPEAHPGTLGLLNLRGMIVPVLDLRHLCQRPSRRLRHTDHLIVVEDGQQVLGLQVDRALDLIRLQRPTGSTQPTGSELVAWPGTYEEQLVHVLDPRNLARLAGNSVKQEAQESSS